MYGVHEQCVDNNVYLTFLTPADWDTLRGGEGSCSSSPGTEEIAHTHKHTMRQHNFP